MAPINTDLNVAPPQVLDSTYYEAFRKRSRKFFNTSLDMGYSFANEVPSVNVVGSGSAIKKILMEPYAAGPLSLICHKVGKTVYLDNHQFSRKQKCELLPQLYWRDDEPPATNFTPQLSLYENLIWNSPISASSSCESVLSAGAELVLRESGIATSSSNLEFPKMFNSYSYRITSENSPGSLAHLWEFHDFRMLVDVDLPIFGGGRFPSVSIHLSEETKPISVLTGMDIMLDQLMCNLSETILVYHEHGLVKDYEVLVKEEIPHITGSEFDPSNLKNITENIMSFLSKNMTEQGHTYWLFRGESRTGSTDMKLYDLTSICPDLACNPNWNPFLVPVVTLLYKLSLDLMEKSAKGRSEKLSNVIYGLLNAAAKLVENEDLAEMRACIHHSLAGVYLMYGSGEGKFDPDFLNLIDSLDEVLTDGYAKLTSAIQVASLTRSSSSYSYENDQNTRSSSSSSKRPPNVGVESECAIQALEHCLQALNALDGIDIDMDQMCPFKPDSPDEVAAMKTIRTRDNLAIRRMFRHAILIRAASAYLPLVYQALCLERNVKAYNYSRCATTLCGAVLSTRPVSRHTSICHALLQVFLSTFAHAASELTDELVDTTALNNAISYRDRRFMELATFGVVMKGLSPLDRNVSRAAMALMMTGGKFTNLGQAECSKEGDKRANAAKAMEYVEIAKHIYTKALEMLSAYNRKDLRDSEVVLYANSAATARLEYSIKVKFFKEPVTSASVRALVDDVCASFRKIFEIVRPDFETQNGSSVYSNSLVDFGIALYTFAQDLKEESDQEKRVHYLEAAVRALRDVLKRRGPRNARSKAIEKITEIYYILLRLKSNAIVSRAWLMGLASNITDIEPNREKCLERYRKLWECAQCLLRSMNQEWRNNPTTKQAYICLLNKLPDELEAKRTFIIESLAKAITALGGKQLHPLGSP
ncbi:unnamed protein product [Strongylus vulgaris]|uniref:EDRF1 N-terminal domain-containing protein n=1 Tax=Strongylus vulgaris TaxID=40348 RepID=A0A3P7INZ9_STRVU|nr:unnamed protein product [Strongylus vulgaris]